VTTETPGRTGEPPGAVEPTTGPLPAQRGASQAPDPRTTPLTPLQALERNYRAAFLRYLPRRHEEALHAGYELGRSAVAGGLSILQLAQVHHDVLSGVLRESPPDEMPEVAMAASEFFLEVLATHDMAQRVFLDER